MRAIFFSQHGARAAQIKHRAECGKNFGYDLNFLLRKMVSKTMVKGMMASLVICYKKQWQIQRQEHNTIGQQIVAD
jgi:hypothetical protein